MKEKSQQTLSDARRRPSKLTYDWYINSASWERRKVAYYAKHPKKCRACGSTEEIHLHHHTYTRLGKEHDNDLIPLCREHHDAVHELHRSAGFNGTLTAATRHVVGGPLHPRKRKRPGRRERSSHPKRGADPVNAGMDRILKARREEMVHFDQLVQEFEVSKTMLRRQGYHHSVPLSRVMCWREKRPDWMKMA